ncbi:MAG: ParA family protein [Spirochaetia bacterium]|nr:ParA family protein [Spirochaetia bacterium]
MGYIISIANQKGGVAKTTTAIHLSIALSQKNHKTLLIDLDPQRNSTGVLLKKMDFPADKTIYSAFQKQPIQGDMIYQTEYDNLFIIPSTIKIVEIENLLAGMVDGFFRLSGSINDISREFDFIIMDCPPSLSILTVNALVAATDILIPLQISKFSIDGLNGLLDVINTVQKRYNPKLKILGGVFTFYDERTTIARAMIKKIPDKIHILKTKIPKSVSVEEAFMLKSDLFSYAPRNKVTLAYKNLSSEVINELE